MSLSYRVTIYKVDEPPEPVVSVTNISTALAGFGVYLGDSQKLGVKEVRLDQIGPSNQVTMVACAKNLNLL